MPTAPDPVRAKAGTKATVVTNRGPWSIFKNTIGGTGYGKVSHDVGQEQATGWAYALLQQLGVKKPTGSQVQFVYDWELAEGGGGLFNPLNVGPGTASHREAGLLSLSQYGGGAAAYDSLHSGVVATADYLHMPNFQQITKDLTANNVIAARADLIKSPWAASHYGGGKALPTTGLPKGIKIQGGTIASDPKALMPGGVRGIVDDIGSGASSAGGAIASGAGTVASGVGSGLTGFLKNPIVLVVGVVLLIVLLKR